MNNSNKTETRAVSWVLVGALATLVLCRIGGMWHAHDPLLLLRGHKNGISYLESIGMVEPFPTSQTETEETSKVGFPVIGVLTQPLRSSNKDTMIAASYIKWLEVAGIRSIAIPYHWTNQSLLWDVLQYHVDGVLFTGGASDVPGVAQWIWDFVVQENLQNKTTSNAAPFPLWGTCLGFEYLLQLGSGNRHILQSNLDANNISLPLEQVVPPSRLYQPDSFRKVLQTYNLTMNNHEKGISPDKFSKTPSLNEYWHVTSINTDRNGKPFVSTMEPKDPDAFPVYGVQYHPEKNAFEYATYPHSDIPFEGIDHSPIGIAMSVQVAQFLGRLVHQRWLERKTPTDFDRFAPVTNFATQKGLSFEETYVIPGNYGSPYER